MATLSTESPLPHTIPPDTWTRRIRASPSVTRNRERVALCIQRHPGISNPQIARRLKLSERTVTRCTNDLIVLGWLTLHSEGRRGTTYADNQTRHYHLGLPGIDTSCPTCERVDRVTESPRTTTGLSPLTRGIAASPTAMDVTGDEQTQRRHLTLVTSSSAAPLEDSSPHPESTPQVPLPPRVETEPSPGDRYAATLPLVAYVMGRMHRLQLDPPAPPTRAHEARKDVS